MNPLAFLLDLVVSTIQMMATALAGVRLDELRWIAFDVRGVSTRRLWWVATVLSISPASVAVCGSEDGRWLYVHTLMDSDAQRRAFASALVRAAGLRGAYLLAQGPEPVRTDPEGPIPEAPVTDLNARRGDEP
jgi:hypothetical protein